MIKFYVLDAILTLTLYVIFIPLYSYWAAAWLTVMSEIIMLVSAWYVLVKHTGVRFEWQVPAKALTASLVMYLCLWPLSSLHLLALVALGVIIYFAALYLLKGWDKEMIKEVIRYQK